MKKQTGKAKMPPTGKTANPPKSDQRQSAYDIFVSQGVILAGPVADKLKQTQIEDPVTTIGDALFDIGLRIEREGAKQGIKFDLGVMLSGINEIMGSLVQMAGMKLDEEQMKAVIGHVVGRYLDDAVSTGKMTREQVAAMAKQPEQGNMGANAPTDRRGLLGGVPQSQAMQGGPNG